MEECTLLRKIRLLTHVALSRMVFAVAAIALTASLAIAAGRTLPPRNELPSDPRFPAFLSALTEAVQRRDAGALGALMAPNVRGSFGGDPGVEETLRHWEAQDPNSRLWPTLERMLRLGGVATADGGFEAPQAVSRFPEDLDDDYAVTASSRAVLRAQPAASARVVVRAPFAIVRVLEWTNDTWAKVSWDNRVGWIMAEDLVSPSGPRLRAEPKPEGWRIVWLVEGD